jgi:hypothetical protein
MSYKDLLVVLLLGGTTRSPLRSMTVPVPMSH